MLVQFRIEIICHQSFVQRQVDHFLVTCPKDTVAILLQKSVLFDELLTLVLFDA